MPKKKKISKEKQIITIAEEKNSDADLKTETIAEEELQNQIPNIIEAISELVELIDLSDKKHLIAAERIAVIEKSIAGLTFFMDLLLHIPPIRNSLPDHVREALEKKHKETKTEAETIQEEKSEVDSIPLKDKISFLRSEAEKVTKKMR